MASATSATAATAAGTSNGDKSLSKTRPEKPDEEKHKQELAEKEKEHTAAQDRLNAIKAKIDLTKPRDKDSPTVKRQTELRGQLGEIRKQQGAFKSSRGSTQEKIGSLDAALKARIAEQKAQRARVPFKSVDEVDREIGRLEKQVEAGTMKLVDEKKALDTISGLRKQRKNFAAFEQTDREIADLKSQIAELRKGLDNPEAKALSEKYNGIAKELDTIKAEQDEAFKGLNSLRDERTKLQGEQSTAYAALKAVKDNYYKAKSAFRDYENELWKQKQERQKAERDSYAREKRKKAAEKLLEEASAPAYMDEIMTAEGLIHYFDPNTPVESKPLRDPSGFAAAAQRQVENTPFKGTALSKKEDRDDTYFAGTGGKKGKKGKKGANGTTKPAESKFQLSVGIYEQMDKVKVDAPASQADVPRAIEQLKEKVDKWKADQAAKTKENIAKAQARVDAFEAEATEETNPLSQRSRNAAKKPAIANDGVNGEVSATAELKQEEDAVADVTEELEEAAIEDSVAA